MLHRKTRFLAAVAVAATGLLSALASPAQDLFDEASYRLLFNYSGFSTVDLKGLVAKYQVALDKACAGKGESCGFDVAHKIIPDMLEELGDDHSGFYPPARNEDRQRQRQGLGSEALRVGINHQAIDGSSDRLVVRVRQDGPAAKAGLIRGDRITGLNGKPASEYREGFTEAMTAAIGTGKPVILNIVRGGTQKLDITLTGVKFETSEMPSIIYRPDGVAVLTIPNFDATFKVGPKVHELVADAKAKNAKAIIVDLRDDPGGSSADLVISLGAFLPASQVAMTYRTGSQAYVFEKGSFAVRNNKGVDTYKQAIEKASLWEGPVAVLVNVNSYSSSEYFAAALQQVKRGVVYGEITGGLGNTSSQTFNLIDGSAIQVTVGRSTFSFGGPPYPEKVTPDVQLKDDLIELARTGRDLVLERAVQDLLAGK